MFLRKMQIKSWPKTGFGMCMLTVAVTKIPKFLIQPETNLRGWNVLGMKISFQLLTESIHFPLERGFHGNFNLPREVGKFLLAGNPLPSSSTLSNASPPPSKPGQTSLCACSVLQWDHPFSVSELTHWLQSSLRFTEISLVLCCFCDRCCSLPVHSLLNMPFAAAWTVLEEENGKWGEKCDCF